jgi:hypothetical protein
MSSPHDARYAALKARLDECPNLKYNPGSLHNPTLVDGLYYAHRTSGDWVLSFYRNVKTQGNDVELAVDPYRLGWPNDDSRPARRWLEHQRDQLQHLESGIHAHQIPNAIRIGLTYDGALAFASALRGELAKPNGRWAVTQPSATTASQHPEAPATPEQTCKAPSAGSAAAPAANAGHSHAEATTEPPFIAIALRMLITTKATCVQSGSTSTVVAKSKELRFRDDQHFLEEVTALLQQAAGRCSVSQVLLDDTGTRAEFTPSLDRKDSNGHYAPGNLQIVARFINRWKSDMPDAEFRKLLAAVRAP